MMQPFTESPSVRAVFAEASDALNEDLWKLVSDGPADALNLTVNTQPLMLTAGYAVYRAWRDAGGPEPAMVAGHSLGEYTALVAAGVIAFRDAVPLVRFRAQAMQEAVPIGSGAMAAILGLDDDAVRALCSKVSGHEVVEAVNYNAPSQVVIAGHRAAVERAAAAAKEAGAKRALMLPVSAPFHSSLLEPAARRLKEYLASIDFHAPAIDVVNNVDVAVVREPAAIKTALSRQACSPVRWVEVMSSMVGAGITHVVECGPGRVLGGLAKRIAPALQVSALADPNALVQTLEAIQ